MKKKCIYCDWLIIVYIITHISTNFHTLVKVHVAKAVVLVILEKDFCESPWSEEVRAAPG